MRIASTVPLFLLLASNHAFGDPASTVAIGVNATIRGEKNGEELRNTVPAEALAGLVSSKLEITAALDSQIAGQARDCEDATCLQDLAKAANLALAVQVRIQGKKTGKKGKLDYEVSMLVARDTPDRNSWHEESECSECDVAAVKHLVFLLAGTIGERITKEAQKPVPVPAPAPPTPTVEAPPTPPPVAIVAPAPPAAKREWYVPRYLSITGIGVGAALVGTGIYLHHLNGQGTCTLAPPQSLCPRSYSTGSLGTGLMVGGGAAAVAGLVGLIFFGPNSGDSHVALGSDGSSISVSGAF